MTWDPGLGPGPGRFRQGVTHEAKSNLSRLLDRAAAGEEVVIARAGRPVARLMPLAPARAERRFGLLRGQLTVAADFDATPGWLLDAFEGESEREAGG